MKLFHICLLILAFLFAGASAYGQWTPLLEDDFDREMVGENWRIMRGDWRIEDGRMRVTRAWSSDNSILSTVLTPRGGVRAVVGIELDAGSTIQIGLRTGEHFWGGGGYPDFFDIHFRARPGTPEPTLDGGFVIIAPDQRFTVELTIEGRQGVVKVNGETIAERDVPAARSEINRHFYLNCMPNGWVDFVRLYTRPDATLAIPIETNTPDENMRATVFAADFIDPENPAQGIQDAIDSLPPTGGAVVLPEGHFMMRRHLKLRSGVALRGQGWDKTILEHVPIHETNVVAAEQDGDVIRVTVENAEPFQVGDGMCFGRQWTHVVNHEADTPNRDMVITAIDGNVLTISGYLPKTHSTIKNFHPLTFAILSEFVEVSDMTLRGPADGPGGGGFNTCPVTFGNIYGARIHRLNVENFPADGVSVQRSADAMVTDNTVTGTSQGFHPGTFTQRFLFARNHSVGNSATGLFFCFANENGVYVRNTVDTFTGYPFVGNNFNLINSNVLLNPMGISSSGYAGLLFNNRIPELSTASVDVEPGFPRYFSGPSYYVFAENRLEKLTFGQGAEAIVAIGNMSENGAPEVTGVTDDILFAEEGLGLAEKLGLERGAGRDAPVNPPALPAPILDGRDYYNPDSPDAGFQAALDELAAEGGTLQLPAGRYSLTTALEIPSNVTLAGYGVATVLHAGADYQGSMIVSRETDGAAVRNLTILGGYSMEYRRIIPLNGQAAGFQRPAVAFPNSSNAKVSGVDVRGWEGTGVQASGSISISDCRTIMLGGLGFALYDVLATIETSLARECAVGIAISRAEAGSRIEGNIVMGSRGRGIMIHDGEGVLIMSNNSQFNRHDGILTSRLKNSDIVGNLVRANNQMGGEFYGIRLIESQGVTFAYNHCSDDQIHPTQATGVHEDAESTGNIIRGNLAAPFHQPYMRERIPAVIAEGEGTEVADNLITSAFPTGSSIEWFEIGFDETPHWYNRRRSELERQVQQAQQQLDRLRARDDAPADQLAQRERELKLAELEQSIFNQQRAVREAKARVMELEFLQADADEIEAARRAIEAEEERLADMEQELEQLKANEAE